MMEPRNNLIIESRRRVPWSSAMGQRPLAVKDLRDRNEGGVMYGFVATGDLWRMLSYEDGAMFQITDNLFVVFGLMGDDKDK
ncbi:hypothetical protein L211DRAFT_83661 [Terfezia boudieri ATCC MYA-4762]|uniref:Uncharacterized protein n=1 Tax=Terfezia boudieri ATCC MYA-4762 TaxID=1051890 RepID=A0A3N4LRH7_9PEZI|nr:hypothetical protein L211DRAFT_83661 [Terfezia boudieri ATCC MYA-4762]